MKEEIVNVSDTCVNLICTFDSNEAAIERESVIKKFCREVSVPGFRKGKVPKNIVLSKFGNAVEQQFKSEIANKSLKAVETSLKDSKVISISDIKHENKDDSIICTLKIDIIPQFELPDYKSIKLDNIDTTVTESEVDNEEKRIFRQYAKYNIVDREAKPGDFVKLSYTGKFEDGTFVADNKDIPSIYGKQSNTWEEAGDTSQIGVKAIVNGIVGTKAGDKKTVSQHYDGAFKIPGLRDKTVTYDLDIAEVRECVMPEITEDLLKNLHAESKDDLRQKIRDSLAASKKEQADFNYREQITSKLSEMADVKIPSSAVDAEATSMMNNFASHQVSHGANIDSLQNHSAEIFESLKPAAATRVKVGAILDDIAKAENIKIDDKDIENTIWHDVYSHKLNPSQYVAEIRKDSRKIADIRRRTLRGKTLNHLLKMLAPNNGSK